jgi:hypothetical protein
MGLGFNTESSNGGGKFLPVVKFDAKSGDMIAVNREPAGDGTWEKNEVEISLPTKVVMDLAGIEIGWLTFVPSYHAAMVKAGEKIPPKPSDDHKQAVRVRVFFKEHGLREFSPTSKTLLRAIDTLHDQFLEQHAANPGKMPVVTIEGTETIKVQTPQGELRFKAPKWSITGWVVPPEGMNDAPPPPPAPAPKAAPAKAPAPTSDIDEF